MPEFQDQGVIARVPFAQGYPQENLPILQNQGLQPLLSKLSRRDSQRSRLMSRSSSFIAPNPGDFDPGLRIDTRTPFTADTTTRESVSADSPKRKTLINTVNNPLKLLNKSKISYRDVMEG